MKIGRNDPCPCGSGIKHKRCCLSKPQLQSTVSASCLQQTIDGDTDGRVEAMHTAVPKGRRRSAARSRRKEQIAACRTFAAHLAKAFDCFDDETAPLWKRTTAWMRAFAEHLPLDDLPDRLAEELDKRLVAANVILGKYQLQKWEDYQHMDEQDLIALQQLHRGFVLDT